MAGGWLGGYLHRDDLFFTIGLSSFISVVWLVENGFFYACDTYGLLQQYKIRRLPSMEPPATLVRTTLLKGLMAHALIGPALMLFIVGPLLRYLAAARGLPSPAAPDTLPPWTITWYNFTVTFLINEIMFYFGHRMLHWRPLYRTVHKQHHSYVGTRSFAAEYAHDVEDVLTAYIPFLTGIVLTGAHFHFIFCWYRRAASLAHMPVPKPPRVPPVLRLAAAAQVLLQADGDVRVAFGVLLRGLVAARARLHQRDDRGTPRLPPHAKPRQLWLGDPRLCLWYDGRVGADGRA